MNRSVRISRHIAALACLVLSSAVSAATMDVLLAGNDLQLEYSSGAAVTISFASDGTYTTSTGSSGTWTLNGEQLCTVRDADSVASCGVLASGKALGDSWSSTDASGTQVTASVVPR